MTTAQPDKTPHTVVIEMSPGIRVTWGELDVAYSRSSGPGGQNVNKVSSKAQIHWHPQLLPDAVRERFVTAYASKLLTDGAITITSQRYRDQPRNLEDCVEKLREMLQAVAVPPKRRRPTKPTKGSVERRLKAKQVTAKRKQGRREPSDE